MEIVFLQTSVLLIGFYNSLCTVFHQFTHWTVKLSLLVWNLMKAISDVVRPKLWPGKSNEYLDYSSWAKPSLKLGSSRYKRGYLKKIFIWVLDYPWSWQQLHNIRPSMKLILIEHEQPAEIEQWCCLLFRSTFHFNCFVIPYSNVLTYKINSTVDSAFGQRVHRNSANIFCSIITPETC